MIRFISCVTLLLLSFTWLPGCTVSDQEKSQLDIRQMQTRTFRTDDRERMMQAVTEALLDDGYIIKQTNNQLGIINGQKKNTDSSYFENRQDIYAITAQVRPREEKTRVRLNIQLTTKSYEREQVFDEDEVKSRPYRTEQSRRVTDQKVYQRLFNKIDKSLFIEEEVYEGDGKNRQQKQNGDAPEDGSSSNNENSPSDQE